MNNPDKHNIALVEIVNKLCAIASHLSGVAERLINEERDVLNGALTEGGDNPCLMEALFVRDERNRLIDAWEQLEIEQRRRALQSSNAAQTNTNMTHVTNMPTIAVTAQIPIDRRMQFELLRSEYDRMQGHDSSWE